MKGRDRIKQTLSEYTLLIKTSPSHFKAHGITLTLLSCFVLLIFLFRHPLGDFDQGIAAHFHDGNTIAENPYLEFINTYVVEIALVGICITTLTVYRVIKHQHNISNARKAFLLSFPSMYFILLSLICFVLKIVLNRPRPYQTSLFQAPFDKPCSVDYIDVFGRSPYPNPCGDLQHSTPSGHTAWMSSVALGPILLLSPAMRVGEKTAPTPHWGSACLWPLWLLLVCATALARWWAGMHFLTDTILGALLSGLVGVGVWLLAPVGGSAGPITDWLNRETDVLPSQLI